MALSGAQGVFDVVPDLTVFGKIVAGGYPAAGGVGGKKEYAQLMAAGLATGKHRAYAVSYTHLDVYKRQETLPYRADRKQDLQPSEPGALTGL